MSKETMIQWCDSTVNPIMGCEGCELFPSPEQILTAVDVALIEANTSGWTKGDAKTWLKKLLNKAWQNLLAEIGQPQIGHTKAVTTTNIWHSREAMEEAIESAYGNDAGQIALQTIKDRLKCYAAKLHLNKALSIFNPTRTDLPQKS